MTNFGPGTLKIGAVDSPVDYSCLVNSLTLQTDSSQTDSTFKLCGTEVPGVLTLTGSLTGNVDLDTAEITGLFQLSSQHAGEVQAFEFTPNNTDGLTAKGQVTILPLPFGGDEYGAAMTGDFTWATVGDIGYYRADALVWTQSMAPRTAAPVEA